MQTWCLYDGHHKDCDNANCNVNAMSMPKMGFLCKEGYTLHGVHSRIVVIPADTLQSESGQTKRSPSHFISVPTFKMMQSRPGVSHMSFIPMWHIWPLKPENGTEKALVLSLRRLFVFCLPRCHQSVRLKGKECGRQRIISGMRMNHPSVSNVSIQRLNPRGPHISHILYKSESLEAWGWITPRCQTTQLYRD